MPTCVTVRELLKGPYLKLYFSVITNGNDESTSKLFNIDDLAMVRFKFGSSSQSYYYSVKKHELAKKYTVKMNIECNSNKYSRQLVCTEDWTEWIVMGHFTYSDMNPTMKNVVLYRLEVAMTVSNVKQITFPQLYDETEFCDFHLSTADGSGRVAVHKVCLISHSDIFKRMLITKWKETEEDCIKIKGVTVQTLQDLKDYIYLGTLPHDGLCPLLLLAKCYMMESLKEECVTKLAEMVEPEDLYKLQEFAADNKLYELIRAIVELTPDTTVQKAHELKRKQQNESENDGNNSMKDAKAL